MEYEGLTLSHAGYLVESMIENYNSTIEEISDLTNLSRDYIVLLIDGEIKIDAETSIILGKVFNSKAELFLSIQNRYDIYHAKNKLDDKLEKIKPLSLSRVKYDI